MYAHILLYGGIVIYPYITIFGFSLGSYGICIVLAALAGGVVAIKNASVSGIAKDDALYTFIFGAVGALVGSKLLYLVVSFPTIWKVIEAGAFTMQHFVALLGNGFVFYGGLIGAVLMAYYYIRRYRLDTVNVLQTLVPVIPLMHAIGRVGCFFAGCCYGKPFDPPIGMLFNRSPVAPHDVYLFPVQLLEAGLNILLFVLLEWLFVKKQKVSLLGIYFVVYPLIRFITEYFRYDTERGFFLGISTSQWISFLLIPIGIILLIKYRKQKKVPN